MNDLCANSLPTFGDDLCKALSLRPHQISPKYFYDAEGSYLFDRICKLPEYYLTRTESGILEQYASEISQMIAPHAELIEFGAGSLEKVGTLLKAAPQIDRFVPIDISGEHLASSVQALRTTLRLSHPQIDIVPLVTDYTHDLKLPPKAKGAPSGPCYGFFPGSSIGNFAPEEALTFLRRVAGVLQGGALILGTDLIKSPHQLHAAYNDSQGVTAEFNLNILARANRDLGANFDLKTFAHSAFYNPPLQRIEMHLMSLRRQQIELCGQRFTLEEGESLHTENSYKFSIAGLQSLAAEAGFLPGPVWTDPDRLFAVHWLNAPG